MPVSYQGLPLAEPTENQSAREPGKLNPQGHAQGHRAEQGKVKDGLMTNRKRTDSLAVGWDGKVSYANLGAGWPQLTSLSSEGEDTVTLSPSGGRVRE